MSEDRRPGCSAATRSAAFTSRRRACRSPDRTRRPPSSRRPRSRQHERATRAVGRLRQRRRREHRAHTEVFDALERLGLIAGVKSMRSSSVTPCRSNARRLRRERLRRRRPLARHVGLRHGALLDRPDAAYRSCGRTCRREPCFVICATAFTGRRRRRRPSGSARSDCPSPRCRDGSAGSARRSRRSSRRGTRGCCRTDCCRDARRRRCRSSAPSTGR